MLWHFYVRKQIVYIPTLARAQAGFYVDCEPVTSVPIEDSEAFGRVLLGVISKGMPAIPTPSFGRGAPQPVVLKHAKAKSWSEFANGTACYKILLIGKQYLFQPMKAGSHGGWVDDIELAEIYPPTLSIADVVRAIVLKVQKNHST